ACLEVLLQASEEEVIPAELAVLVALEAGDETLVDELDPRAPGSDRLEPPAWTRPDPLVVNAEARVVVELVDANPADLPLLLESIDAHRRERRPEAERGHGVDSVGRLAVCRPPARQPGRERGEDGSGGCFEDRLPP